MKQQDYYTFHVLNTIYNRKEFIIDNIEFINELNELNELNQENEYINKDNNEIITNAYSRIIDSIYTIIDLQKKIHYSFHSELMQYFYNPKKVYHFLLTNPDKHVEDMYN